jgi:hypothetical protein
VCPPLWSSAEVRPALRPGGTCSPRRASVEPVRAPLDLPTQLLGQPGELVNGVLGILGVHRVGEPADRVMQGIEEGKERADAIDHIQPLAPDRPLMADDGGMLLTIGEGLVTGEAACVRVRRACVDPQLARRELSAEEDTTERIRSP